MHLSLCQKHKLRVANAANNLRYGPDPTLVIVYFDSWKSHELKVTIMRNALESGVERTKREKVRVLIYRGFTVLLIPFT